jgi:eukaryotic-like serine/threonine-protein kinase
MFCPYCGASNQDQRFCLGCGKEMPNLQASGAVDSAADPLIGRTLDRKYRLEARLGVGATGTVYRAARLFFGDSVAVKILNPDLMNNQRAVARFYREAQGAALIKHPNVVAIYDFGVSSDEFVYLVMELAEGMSLREMIDQQGALPQETAVTIANQVCAALTEAHKRKVVHRDINPENILIQNTHSGQQVKVFDFGIAALRELHQGETMRPGGLTGMPQYMSPEQCLGETLDGRSDIYSLGIVLYEMLTGEAPFKSPVLSAVIVQQVNQAPPPLRRLNPHISREIESVVLRALDKRREQRPQTASEFARWLTAATDGVFSASSIEAEETFEATSTPEPADSLPESSSFALSDGPLAPESAALPPRRSGKLAVGLFGAALLFLGGYLIWRYAGSRGAERIKTTALQIRGAQQTPTVAPIVASTLKIQPAVVGQSTPSNAPERAPDAAPQATRGSLWELITNQTRGANEAENALGLPDQQMAVIAPGSQIALAYREGQFFGNGPGTDLRLHGPDGEIVLYSIYVRNDSAGAWRKVDVNRRGFIKGVSSHDMGHHGVQQARQVMIKNDGQADLKLDAITALYKDKLFSAPRPRPPRKPLTKKEAEELKEKSKEKKKKK